MLTNLIFFFFNNSFNLRISLSLISKEYLLVREKLYTTKAYNITNKIKKVL